MTTKTYVERMAREVAEWSAKVKALGMANAAGMTPEQAVESEAALTVARDRLFAAQDEYRLAFSDWRTRGFPEEIEQA